MRTDGDGYHWIDDSFYCDVPGCGVIIGANLRGEAPWMLAADHKRRHRNAQPARTLSRLSAALWDAARKG